MITTTKEDELLHWMKHVGIFNSVHVRKWGLDNFYIRADRTCRELVEQGKLRRIPYEESILKGYVKKGQSALGWFEFVSL